MSNWAATEIQERTHSVTELSLERLSAFVAERMGLRVPRDRWRALEEGLCAVAREFGFDEPEACAQWVISSPMTSRCIEILASHVTIGETYFFREKSAFETLEQRILPDLIRSRLRCGRRLKIWSAGCCTGEEAYSIAMVLSRVIPDVGEWNADIVATDINPHFLQKARGGSYGQWSFRQTPGWIQEKYFHKTGDNRFDILPDIKGMVDFKYLNLAEDVYPSLPNNLYGVDVIFCRNVLMYFLPEQAQKVLKGFYRSLVDGGWLIVAPSDLLHVKDTEFVPVHPGNSVLYKKDAMGGGDGQESKPDDERQRLHSPANLEFPHPQPELRSRDLVVPPPQVTARLPDSREEAKATHEQPQRDGTVYEEARKLYQDGHYEEASRRLLARDEVRPDRAEEPEFETDEMELLARVYANQGDLAEALRWCDRVIGAEKLIPRHHYLRASILQEQGQYEEAENSLRQSLFLDPSFVLVHFMLGNLARSQGKERQSEKHFANALRLLNPYLEDEVLSESEGITAGRLKAILTAITEREVRK